MPVRIRIGNKVLRISECKGLASLKGLMFSAMENCDGALIHGNAVWMPFVKHKLDLFFLDEHLRIVDVQQAVPITLHPRTWKVYRCKAATYCLEVMAGLVKAQRGQKVKIL